MLLRNNRGITLINVLIVVIVIFIIASIAIINGTRDIKDAKELQREQNLAMVKTIVNQISIKKSTAGVFTPADANIYGKKVSEVPEIAGQIPDNSVEGWYILEEEDLRALGIEYLDEVYAVNYDENKVLAFSDYIDTATGAVYIATFNGNGGTSSQTTRKIKYGETFKKLPTATRNDYTFIGWYTEANGGQKITEDSRMVSGDTTFYAHWTDGAAEMNDVYYATLQKAIDAVPTDKVERKITLLKNVSEAINIPKNKNVNINLQRYTISNTGNTNVFINNGTLTITNGTIQSDAPTNGAVNNLSGAELTILSGKIIMTGDRQALWNNGGTATIGGNAYLSSSSTARSAVHNLANGTLIITGGTIISTGVQGLKIDNGTVSLGDETSTSLKNSPIIQGKTYGITTSVNFNMYDGLLRGGTGPIDVESRIVLKTGYSLAHDTETISSIKYQVSYLKSNNVMVATINGQNYDTLQKAIDAVPQDNNKIIIRLLRNTNESVIINNNQNIELDLQEHVITNTNVSSTIENQGTLLLKGGTVRSNSPVAVLNKGSLSITSGLVQSEGSATNSTKDNATIFNDSGILNITGGKVISNITGTYGYAIYVCNSSSTLNISGKTEIISNANDAIMIHSSVDNSPVIGIQDSNLSSEYPLIQAGKVGVINNSSQKVKFYDGIIKSINTGITESKVETSYIINYGLDIINSKLYGTVYLDTILVKAASYNGVEYSTVQEAINAVPKNNVEATVTILKSGKEKFMIYNGHNIRLDMHGYTLANKGVSNVIVNEGKLVILNCCIFSDTTQGAINNNATGNLTIMDGKIVNIGTKQAIYNDGGTLLIGGTIELSSVSKDRSTLHNLSNGTITITGGTITSSGAQALKIENGTVTIGDNSDGSLKNVPVLQGVTYGVTASTAFNYYDGIIKGKTDTVDDLSKAVLENGYELSSTTENEYKKIHIVKQ